LRCCEENARKIFIDTGPESWDSAKEKDGTGLGLDIPSGPCRMQFEEELFSVFDRVIHKDFPNPQRIDCPGHAAFLKLAEGAMPMEVGHLLAHIRRCAPCFDELKELRSRARRQWP
jgi:hypothetical protein